MTDLLALVATQQPRLAFALASFAGAMRNRMTGRWPAVREVETLFPDLSHRRAVRVAAAIGALDERNDVFVRCVRRGDIDRVRPSVAIPEALRRIDGPCILGTFHVGAFQTIGVMLEALGKPVLAFRDGILFTPRPPVELQSTKGSAQKRTASFIKAVDYLNRGGLVLMALDAAPAATIATECLNRPFLLARGAFALSRMTAAPIVPLAVRWARKGTEVVVGDPLQGDADNYEQALAAAAARWLDRYLRESPSELGLGLLRELLYRSV